jgi:hypothetical protein
MDFQDLIARYFGAAGIADIAPGALDAGIERIRVDFGLEADRARRFGLWTFLYMLGDAPDLDIAFKTEPEREAARNFMDLVAGLAPD